MKFDITEFVLGISRTTDEFKKANADRVFTGEEIHGLEMAASESIWKTLGLWDVPVIDNRPKTDG